MDEVIKIQRQRRMDINFTCTNLDGSDFVMTGYTFAIDFKDQISGDVIMRLISQSLTGSRLLVNQPVITAVFLSADTKNLPLATCDAELIGIKNGEPITITRKVVEFTDYYTDAQI